MSLLDDCYISYLNLDHRTDRLLHIQNEFSKLGLEAVRQRGKLPEEYDLTDERFRVMYNRTKGAIGCHMGQVAIMQEAIKQNKHAFVNEDDVVFCSDFHERFAIIDEFIKTHEWDIIWLGGTWHPSSQTWWHKLGHSPDLPKCDCILGVDAIETDSKYMVRTFGAFSTHSYIVNKRFTYTLLAFLEQNIHMSMGIDWLMILLQPKIYAYAFVPGIAKQLDNQSDIGTGMTIFSGFKMLGEHWWQDKMEDFNYDNFKI